MTRNDDECAPSYYHRANSKSEINSQRDFGLRCQSLIPELPSGDSILRRTVTIFESKPSQLWAFVGFAKIHIIFEGTSEIQQLVISSAISGLRIE
jgi:hypothetical protein